MSSTFNAPRRLTTRSLASRNIASWPTPSAPAKKFSHHHRPRSWGLAFKVSYYFLGTGVMINTISNLYLSLGRWVKKKQNILGSKTASRHALPAMFSLEFNSLIIDSLSYVSDLFSTLYLMGTRWALFDTAQGKLVLMISQAMLWSLRTSKI